MAKKPKGTRKLCSICRHGSRAQIDAQLRAGRALRDVAEAFDGASSSALDRHRKHMRGLAKSKSAPAEPPPVTGDLGEHLDASLRRQLAAVEVDPDLSPVDRAKAFGSMAKALNDLKKLTGETLTEREIVRHPRFRIVVDVVVRALEPWPEALQAVGEALQALERGTPTPMPGGSTT